MALPASLVTRAASVPSRCTIRACALDCWLAAILVWKLGAQLPAFAASVGRLRPCRASTAAAGSSSWQSAGVLEGCIVNSVNDAPGGLAGSLAVVAALLVGGSGLRRAQRRVALGLRGLKTGMVGLPNVGKSTLFNALCEGGQADAANFPFCTIEPNVARATVPDPTLHQLAKGAESFKTIPEQIEYVDIAGLVKGASNGEGLGNKFLSNIREVDAIVHVVRCFEDQNITHVDGEVNPIRDIETINLELILSDIDQIERRLVRVTRDLRGKVAGAAEEKEALEKLKVVLEEGKPARVLELDEKEEAAVKKLGLLTKKSVIFAANVSEDDLAEGNSFTENVKEAAAQMGDAAVIVSAKVESELVSLAPDEQLEFLEALGVEESGCKSLIRQTYALLGLRTYYTVGPKETRAWTIKAGWTAPKAAGVIHSDFERGFIRAATVSADEMLECGCSEDTVKKKGLLRIEGKQYVVQEGDVMHFRFQ